MNVEEVQKLAKLARIEITDLEAETLTKEFSSILDYVGEVKNADITKRDREKEDFPLRNVYRTDENPHESGIYTEALLERAPDHDDKFIKVKKIL
jgi:aspartyl-tRNA(Asn)/glutamyl-tRNA(Gln) amidotransferase subunit C